MGHLLLCQTSLLCFRDEYIWTASWDFLQRFFQRKGLLQIFLLTCIFLRDVLSSFILSHYLLWCSQAAVWVAGMRPEHGGKPKRMKNLRPWRAAVPLKYHISAILQIHTDLLAFHLLFVLLLSSIFCSACSCLAPYLVFISKLKCLQVTLLLTSSEAKHKCLSGCQVLLHKSMVHPRSESSWVIEHCSAAAVEHGTSYLKKTPMLVITDLILISHQYAHPFISKYPESLNAKWSTLRKNTPKGFCWAVWQYGKSAESLTLDSFRRYLKKGVLN